jgi:hypothetical protein
MNKNIVILPNYSLCERKYLVDNLRNINLTKIASFTGLHKDRYDRHKWVDSTHCISINGQKYYDHKQNKGGGGAIDFVIDMLDLDDLDFNDAVNWLVKHFSNISNISNTKSLTNKYKSCTKYNIKKKRIFLQPVPSNTQWKKVQEYLVEKRCLPLIMIQQLYDKNRLYADKRANAVFLEPSTSAELHGTRSKKWKGMAEGSTKDKGIWINKPNNPHIHYIALCESAIEAVSYEAMNQGACAVSTTGIASTSRIESLVDWAINKKISIVCAYDNDEYGQKAANDFYQAFGIKWHKPYVGKDWNDTIRISSKLLSK